MSFFSSTASTGFESTAAIPASAQAIREAAVSYEVSATTTTPGSCADLPGRFEAVHVWHDDVDQD